MKLSDFDYHLPQGLIALYPANKRDEARLMVVDRVRKNISHHVFSELIDFLPKPGILVRNNTKVFPARLLGRKNPQGGKAEVLLLKELEANHYEALVKPARRLKCGQVIDFDLVSGTITQELAGGRRMIRFDGAPVVDHLETIGEIPLPPYINRDVDENDKERYQTVYARHTGSVAAPTAGLHFTPAVFTQLRENNIEIIDVTLHVGPGTFRPVKSDDLSKHVMDYEEYSLTEESMARIKNRKLPLTAVGTTSVRVIETVLTVSDPPLSGKTNLFITPGYKFLGVDHLLTNFHLPRSTLLMLVAAFGGTELIMKAYQAAIAEKYRFYSYGDAMLIL